MGKINEIWKVKEDDIPKEERIFEKGKIYFTFLSYIISVGLGWLMIFLLNFWDNNLPRWSDGRYAFLGWAASYFIYFFTMVIPIIVSNILYQKSRCPSYGFLSVLGFITSAILYYFIGPEQKIALYTIFSCSLVLLGNAPSQKDYKIKNWHFIYYGVLGIIAGYISALYQVHAWDVWVWLQFIHIHLFVVLIASVKIRQWAYFYMIGWAISSIFIIIVPNPPFFNLVEQFPGSEIYLIGYYNLFIPPLLVLTILTYFFKIQRKSGIGMNK